MPKAFSTGTTIVGVIYKDGVVLGADTRATAGSIVADKVCDKIHYMQPNMYCAGAGIYIPLTLFPLPDLNLLFQALQQIYSWSLK